MRTFTGLLFFLLSWLAIPLMAQEGTPSEEAAQAQQEIEQLKAQVDSYKPGKSRFLLRGYAHSGLQATKEDVTFEGGSFNPLLIYRQSDRLLFESELEIELNGDEVELGLEYANISYLLSNTLTLRVGKTLTPFGIFVPRLHPAWINKFPNFPLGAGHHSGILPTSDIGAELRGGAYLGASKINYSLYVVNGPRLNTGEDEPEEAGMLHYGDFPDNNKNKTIGARVGFLPFSNSSLEIGVSGMYGKVGDKDSDYEDIYARLYGFDLTYVKNLPSISSVLDIKGQFAVVDVDNASFPMPDDPTGELFYDFDNRSTTYFAQVSLRPALLSSAILRNFEVVGRYSSLETPEGALWETNQTQWDIGLNYWLDWRTLFKLSYRINSVKGEAHEENGHGHDEAAAGENAFFLHWAIGL
jgi:hypothetical protein